MDLSLSSPGRLAVRAGLLIHAKIYIIADKYDIDPLKIMAASRYQKALGFGWDDSAFLRTVELIYDNTVESDRLLRDVVARYINDHLAALLKQKEFIELMKEHGELALDIVTLQLEDSKSRSAQDELPTRTTCVLANRPLNPQDYFRASSPTERGV